MVCKDLLICLGLIWRLCGKAIWPSGLLKLTQMRTQQSVVAYESRGAFWCSVNLVMTDRRRSRPEKQT